MVFARSCERGPTPPALPRCPSDRPPTPRSIAATNTQERCKQARPPIHLSTPDMSSVAYAGSTPTDTPRSATTRPAGKSGTRVRRTRDRKIADHQRQQQHRPGATTQQSFVGRVMVASFHQHVRPRNKRRADRRQSALPRLEPAGHAVDEIPRKGYACTSSSDGFGELPPLNAVG